MAFIPELEKAIAHMRTIRQNADAQMAEAINIIEDIIYCHVGTRVAVPKGDFKQTEASLNILAKTITAEDVQRAKAKSIS